ncbi:MAG: hypothetical protein NTW30_02395 [Candidatus Aenigmarchaeota archaeon]|nr:hypothetical protein [Candidatus Aenigmarchaeota archaeon]
MDEGKNKKAWKKGEKLPHTAFEPTIETEKLRAWAFSKEEAKTIDSKPGEDTLQIDMEKEVVHESRVYNSRFPSDFTARILSKRNIETGKVIAFIKTSKYYTKPREMSINEYNEFVEKFERVSSHILDIEHAIVCTQKDYEECTKDLKKRFKK